MRRQKPSEMNSKATKCELIQGKAKENLKIVEKQQK